MESVVVVVVPVRLEDAQVPVRVVIGMGDAKEDLVLLLLYKRLRVLMEEEPTENPRHGEGIPKAIPKIPIKVPIFVNVNLLQHDDLVAVAAEGVDDDDDDDGISFLAL